MCISRAARLQGDLQGESKDLVWSLIPRHLFWSISLSHSWLSSHILHLLLTSRGPLECSPSTGLEWRGGSAQEVDATGT